MKANRKFLRGDDDAVSPVIAVILMVAITVVLAATVYVWVSGFGANNSSPAKSIGLASGGSIVTDATLDASASDDSYKPYLVTAASPGLKYSDLKFKVGGVDAARSAGTCAAASAAGFPATDAGTHWTACSAALGTGSTLRAADALVSAGDYIFFAKEGATISAAQVLILDSASNSVILTLTAQ